ncbi:MAG: MaoC family dehydratase N-terminal domain-containing protein, partial [Chloroflexi bacterium]|nr:MaoC family dehydratase N-terminal domain-containing protein [Chloroflexota bacterium]
HIDNEFAKSSQFGRTIAHGMLIAASISEVMTTAFKVDWLRSGRMKLRFRAPVFPGDTIVAQGEIKDIREQAGKREAICSVDVRKRDGELVISGEATVSVPLDA